MTSEDRKHWRRDDGLPTFLLYCDYPPAYPFGCLALIAVDTDRNVRASGIVTWQGYAPQGTSMDWTFNDPLVALGLLTDAADELVQEAREKGKA